MFALLFEDSHYKWLHLLSDLIVLHSGRAAQQHVHGIALCPCPTIPVALPIQELTASRVTSSFKKLVPATALVTRDGNESTVPATDLVVGDVVRLRTGSRIPADVRLIQVSDLKVILLAVVLFCVGRVPRADSFPFQSLTTAVSFMLQVEMSSLTGETKPVSMRVTAEDRVVVLHSHNIGFSSSLVITGEAIGVVIRYCILALQCS